MLREFLLCLDSRQELKKIEVQVAVLFYECLVFFILCPEGRPTRIRVNMWATLSVRFFFFIVLRFLLRLSFRLLEGGSLFLLLFFDPVYLLCDDLFPASAASSERELGWRVRRVLGKPLFRTRLACD